MAGALSILTLAGAFGQHWDAFLLGTCLGAEFPVIGNEGARQQWMPLVFQVTVANTVLTSSV